MMLELWNKVRNVPETAKKPITGGRLNGKTDINPLWRLKTLTENFGICGVGWKYEIVSQHMEPGANGEVAAFTSILLYIKQNGEWSAPIPGNGGSMFVAKERSGLNTSDECYKMALTDAISVACKALGVGADVYWERDKTKYNKSENETRRNQTPESVTEKLVCEVCKKPITDYTTPKNRFITAAQLAAQTRKEYGKCMCAECSKAAKNVRN